jgi:hypothetical protein
MGMKSGRRAILFLGAAMILFGCNKQGSAATGNVPAGAGASANTASPAEGSNVAASPKPEATGTATADFLVGKWSAIGEDCSATVEFRKDGTAVTPAGEAKWTLTGDKLQFDYADGSKHPPSVVKPLGKDRLQTTTESGKTDTEKRC